MQKLELKSNSPLETIKIAKTLAKFLNIGDTIVLTGELGAGKTKFTEGFLSYYNLQDEISSPTFTIVNEYQNDYEYSYMVYVKGVIMFDSLKNMVGEKSVISGLRKYYTDNKFKMASTEAFLKAFEQACHKDLRNKKSRVHQR